mmetsp:Transcript_15124/g.31262  ORF Transcript_15124/g.31262 Transcript_15124/m.31262 type:complete len:236 (+) Transcript_15124:596-1303(+)
MRLLRFFEILQQFYKDDDGSEEVAEQKKKAVYCKWKATEILKAIKEGRTPTPGGYGEEANKGDEEEKTPGTMETKDESPVAVETVEEDCDGDKEGDEKTTPNMPVDEDSGDDSGDDEGTEVQLGPPPAYPVGIEPVEPPFLPPAPPVKPPMTFNLPPPAPSTIPPPVVPTSTHQMKPKKTSFFGLGSKKKSHKKVGKTEIADATELTRFALAALEDKDAELAAERLQQALQHLGR